MIRRAIEISQKEEADRAARSEQEQSLTSQAQNNSAAEAELVRQRTALE